MHPVSQLYDQYLKERARQWAVKLDIAGTEYGMDSIIDFSVENNLTPSDDFAIGQAIPSKLVLRLKTESAIPSNARVVPYIALNLPEEYEGNAGVAWQDNEDTWATADYLWNGAMTEWLPLGEFFVDRREKIGQNTWEFVCYDKLVYADVAYVSQLSYPATMQAVWDEICTQLGFTYDSSVVIGSYTIPVAPTGYSCRQVMAYIAGASGASVYVGKDGVIKFRRYSASDAPVMEVPDSEYIAVTETGPVKTYTRVVVVYDPDEGLAYEAGSGDENHILYVEIPFGTQTIADALLVQLSGFSFVPIQMDMRGYPQIEVGDRIRYGRPAPALTWGTADMAWQDADFSWDGYYDGGQSLCLNMTYGFKGGLSLSIDAPAKSEQESEFGVDGSLTAAINRLNRNAVKLGKTYYGMTVTATEGLTIERSDHASKLVLNSDDLSWYVGNSKALHYDAQANKLKFSGDVEMLGGTISWSNVNPPDIEDIPDLRGYLTHITATGIYTGTVKANQIIVGDGGAKIGDDLIESAATWNGKTTLLTPTGIYTGTITTNQIVAGTAKISAALIEDLVVGSNVIMGPNASLSWAQITNRPTIPQTAEDVGALPFNSPRLTYIGPTGIYTGKIEASQIEADSLSAISANLGTVTAGVIQGVTILGGIISGPTISGATVIGGVIQTKAPGTYPRIELSEPSNRLLFEASADSYFRIMPVGGVFNQEIVNGTSVFFIGKQSNLTALTASDNLYLLNNGCAIQLVGNAVFISAPGGVYVNGVPI